MINRDGRFVSTEQYNINAILINLNYNKIDIVNKSLKLMILLTLCETFSEDAYLVQQRFCSKNKLFTVLKQYFVFNFQNMNVFEHI